MDRNEEKGNCGVNGWENNIFSINPEIAAYCISFFYGAALYIIQLLIPFYLHGQGFSAWEIGTVVSSSSLLRVLVHPFAGAISDRFGERHALIGSFTAITIAALCFSRFSSFTAIFAIQIIFMSISRTFYWPAIHSYCSRISPLKAPHILGRVNSIFGAGSMIGLGLSGYLATLLGFERAFLFSAFFGGVAVLVALSMPIIPRKLEIIGAVDMLKKLVRIAQVKQLFAGTLCGFIAAIPFVLLGSFYPIFLEKEGLTKELIGILSAGFNIGYILIGIVVGQVLKLFGFRNLATFSMLLMGLSMFFIFTFPFFYVLLPVMLVLGISTGGPNLIYQIVGSIYSNPEDRGASIAFSSYGFSLAYLVVPLFSGLLVEQLGIREVLMLLSIIVLIIGTIIRYLFNILNLSDSWV